MLIHLDKTAVELLPEGGVMLVESRTLVVADVHLGKSATFRTLGIPVPEGDTLADLTKISNLIKKYSAKKLIVAGDLVHASDGLTPHVLESLATWLEQLEIPVILTEGNHDRKARLPHLTSEVIEVVDKIEMDGVVITHFPDDLTENQAGIAGHVHPAYHLKVARHQNLRLKGFYHQYPHRLILPAFSQFTGNHCIEPQHQDQFYSITEDQIHAIPLKIRET